MCQRRNNDSNTGKGCDNGECDILQCNVEPAMNVCAAKTHFKHIDITKNN